MSLNEGEPSAGLLRKGDGCVGDRPPLGSAAMVEKAKAQIHSINSSKARVKHRVGGMLRASSASDTVPIQAAAHKPMAKTPTICNQNRRMLRRTQSAGVPTVPSVLSSDNESDCELPDALSLLKTPEKVSAATAKRKSDSAQDNAIAARPPPQTSKAGPQSKRARRRKTKLVKSASDVACTGRAEDTDDLAEFDDLQVPGELVLARYMRKYYPARIISQPQRRRYEVLFFDGFVTTLSRASMFTMYDEKFQTCPLGNIQLIGDEPVREDRLQPSVESDQISLEAEQTTFSHVIQKAQAVRPYLDRLHGCPPDQLDEVGATEVRLLLFFGRDKAAKKQLASRVLFGFLNRLEFNFLGRLLSNWYREPPRAAQPTKSSGSDSGTEVSEKEPAVSDVVEGAATAKAANSGCGSVATTAAADPGVKSRSTTPVVDTAAAGDPVPDALQSSLALRFVHEVLLPHAIKRMTMDHEHCTLEESEARMRQSSSEHQWVEHILAARSASKSATTHEQENTAAVA
ncbi:hypothetical protein GGI07_004524 [Coemansia sp. Benny D115]|nr:hypothetical protein GGI07_004524 [Coemansia sp. Benny D115]